jgi:hypothetical protein
MSKLEKNKALLTSILEGTTQHVTFKNFSKLMHALRFKEVGPEINARELRARNVKHVKNASHRHNRVMYQFTAQGDDEGDEVRVMVPTSGLFHDELAKVRIFLEKYQEQTGDDLMGKLENSARINLSSSEDLFL